MRNKDIISILDLDKNDLLKIFHLASDIERDMDKYKDTLRGNVLALLFFEPSTRTMYSFQTAMARLGGNSLVFSDTSKTSIAKGETLGDTVRMFDGYADAIVIRHRVEGAAKYAADIANSPVINAGDGTHHHPTQAVIDLYTIWKYRGKIGGYNVGVLGDLKYGRASTSFIYGVSMFGPKKLYLISPEELRLKGEVKSDLERMGIEYIETTDLTGVLSELDILYVTRIQKERFPDPAEYERVRGSYIVNMDLLKNAKDSLMIMHPLPRVDEISTDVDNTQYAYYFKQAKCGVPIRMALLKLIIKG